MVAKAIILLGPPGSGKGTQSRILAKLLGYYHLEMGKLLREEGAKDTLWGKKIANTINHGLLLSDELLVGFLFEVLDTINITQGVIFDGVPRRLKQAQLLLGYVKSREVETIATIFLDIPLEVVRQRLKIRSTSESRKDDRPEVVERRIREYEHDTLQTIEYLKSETNYYHIDAMGTVELVADKIKTALIQ